MVTRSTFIPLIHLYTCLLSAFQLYSKNVTPTNSPFTVVFSAGRFSSLSCDKLNIVLHCLLQQAGFDQSSYASHSFCTRAATTAATAGLPTWLMVRLGRWTSNAYRSYIYILPSYLHINNFKNPIMHRCFKSTSLEC